MRTVNCRPGPARLAERRTCDCRRSVLLLAFSLAMMVSSAGVVFAQASRQTFADPVDALREVLKTPFDNVGVRELRLKNAVTALGGIGDLRRALALSEWRDDDLDAALVAVDMPCRALLAERFERAVRERLVHGDATDQLAIINLISEMGVVVRAAQTHTSMTRAFAPDLSSLMSKREANVCE